MVTDKVEEKDILERALLFVLDVLGRNKLKLLFALVLGGVLGISSSFLKPKKYRSNSILLPEMNSGSMGSLGSLASMAGIEVGGAGESDAIRADILPSVLKSSPALIHLLNQPVKTDSGKQYPTLLAYFEAAKGVKVDKQFLQLKTEDSVYKYKPAELGVIGSLKSSIESEYDKKAGLITLSVEMEDPHVAATVLSNSISYLRDYVTEYRYGKKHSQKDFINSELKVAKDRMLKARHALQSFRDSNRNLFLNTAKIGEDKLADEYTIAQGVYNSLQQQSETLNITEKQTKPVFQVVEPPMIPNGKSSPNRLFYGIGGAIACFMLLAVILVIINARRPEKPGISSSIA